MRRAPAPMPVRILAVAAALTAAFAAADAAWGQAAPIGPNYSSHAAPFFEGLLAGRVWVLERPNARRADDRGTVWAHYHAPDGTLLACAHFGGSHAAASARWRVVPSREFRALYNYLEPGAAPDPGRRRGHTPLFYDPESGRLHNEAVSGETWAVASRGWVQESWPRSMKEACPDLALPAGLPVNERQTAAAFDAMMAQDGKAAVRHAPGSHLRGPGATGIAAARGRPALPAAALGRFLAENDGFVLTDTAGARHVLVLGTQGDELWLLDNEGRIADTGHLVAAGGRRGDRGSLRARAGPPALPGRPGAAVPADRRALRRDAPHRPAGGERRGGCSAGARPRRDRGPLPWRRDPDRGGRRGRGGSRHVALVARRAGGDAGGLGG